MVSGRLSRSPPNRQVQRSLPKQPSWDLFGCISCLVFLLDLANLLLDLANVLRRFETYTKPFNLTGFHALKRTTCKTTGAAFSYTSATELQCVRPGFKWEIQSGGLGCETRSSANFSVSTADVGFLLAACPHSFQSPSVHFQCTSRSV